MKNLLGVAAILALAGCQPVCTAFPECSEQPLQSNGTVQFDVEHNSKGQVQGPVLAAIGDLLEIPIEPACTAGNQLGIVSKPTK